MNGKIVLCFAVVFVGQAMSAATGSSIFDWDELKKISDQITQSSLSVTTHMLSLSQNPADAQKSVEKAKTFVTKTFADIETEVLKLKEIVRKNADSKLVEKFDEADKEIKKQLSDAKAMIDDKVGKPLNEKFDLKKLTDTIIKSTKDAEANANKMIDGIKNKQ